MVPVNGQKQLSIGLTWQVEVTVAPVLSIAVQPVQCDVTLASAGMTSSAALKSIAPKLPSKSIFFFMSDSLFFCPVQNGR